MDSALNSTNIPLNAGGVFIGQFENILLPTATISLIADTTTQIDIYQSINKIQVNHTTFLTQANQYFEANITLTQPYVYFSVRNNSMTNQSLLNFSVIYKNAWISRNTGSSSLTFTSNGSYCVSNSIFLNQSSSNLTIFGNSTPATTLTIQYSNNNQTWYSSQYSLTTSASSDFGFSIGSNSINYIRLLSSDPSNAIVSFLNYS
jgi:hypothetical protein